MATLATSAPASTSSSPPTITAGARPVSNSSWKWIAIASLALFVLAAGFATWQWIAPVSLSSDYQAVLLANGSVYFGRLEGIGSRFPVLRDVYYVQSGVDPETKQPKNILLKRGTEWHSPDRMILNASQIVLIEPVGAHSRVASLIQEIKTPR